MGIPNNNNSSRILNIQRRNIWNMITINKNFIKGSFILLIVFNVYSFLNFIFQASMARTLSIADYGILAALFYLIYVLSIFTEAIQTVFARQSSREKDNGKLKNLLNRIRRRVFQSAIERV